VPSAAHTRLRGVAPTPRKRNVYLIGPMGVGKTAVGRQLAKELKLEFLDSDAEIERRTGVDIAYIFEKEGEARFRRREKEAIAELTQRSGIVLATGGGAILDSENRRRLSTTGFVVYLRASLEQQLERTRQTRNRPLLLDGDPRQVLERLNEAREPLYLELAALTVDTTRRRVKNVVADICAAVRTQPWSKPAAKQKAK
jgi:shikimate kinase